MPSRVKLSLEFYKLLIQCPLSLWERVRVRAVDGKTSYFLFAISSCPHPLPLSQRERGEKGIQHGTKMDIHR
jgi:hypothetical protein